MTKIWILILIIILALFAGIISIVILLRSQDTKNSNNNREESGSCTQAQTTFTAAPVDLDKLLNIAPLGNLNPSGHTFPTVHMYYFMEKTVPGDYSTASVSTNVYAPIDTKIYSISVSTRTDLDPDETDYSLYFRTCKDFEFYFIHVRSLSEKLQKYVENVNDNNCDEYSTGGRDFKNCKIDDLDIEVKSGETLGTAAGGVDASALDFGVIDYRIQPHVFANPERWEEAHRDDVFYRVCSTDYYEGELKQTLESKLKEPDGNPRTVEPICGTNAQDVPGTAQGIWFLSGIQDLNSEDPHIALVHDNFDPSIGAFSNGTSLEKIGIPSGTYIFNPEKSGKVNADFNLIEPGNEIYCYEVNRRYDSPNQNFSILVQLPSEETLRLGKRSSSKCGTGPWTLNDYVEFVR